MRIRRDFSCTTPGHAPAWFPFLFRQLKETGNDRLALPSQERDQPGLGLICESPGFAIVVSSTRRSRKGERGKSTSMCFSLWHTTENGYSPSRHIIAV